MSKLQKMIDEIKYQNIREQNPINNNKLISLKVIKRIIETDELDVEEENILLKASEIIFCKYN